MVMINIVTSHNAINREKPAQSEKLRAAEVKLE